MTPEEASEAFRSAYEHMRAVFMDRSTGDIKAAARTYLEARRVYIAAIRAEMIKSQGA